MARVGDDVYLLGDNEKRGMGVVHCMDPMATCHFEIISDTCISVRVLSSLDNDYIIPFPTMDATSMFEAIGSIIKWPKNDILIDSSPHDEELNHAQQCFTERGSLKEKKVIIWNENCDSMLAEGIIFLVYPHDVVQFKELGETHLGVIVEKSLTTCHSTFSKLSLISWPIKQLTFETGESLIQVKAIDCEWNMSDVDVQGDEDDDIEGESIQESTNDDHSIVNQYCYEEIRPKRAYTYKVRQQRRIAKNVNREVKCTLEDVQRVSTVDCCSSHCCQFEDRINIMNTRSNYWGQSFSQRNTYLLDCLGMAHRGNDQFEFIYQGRKVCTEAWYNIHGISKSTFYRYREKFLNGVCSNIHGNQGLIKKGRTHVEIAKALIQEFVDKNADQMPHKSIKSIYGVPETQLALPSIYKQIDILKEINEKLTQLGYKTLSQPTFNKIWNTMFTSVLLSKASTFSKCDICTSLKLKIESTKNQEERAKYFMQRRVHMLQQMSCRNVYYAWRSLSELYPSKYLCIIHDKMDQAKTTLPHLFPIPKGLNGVDKLPISLTGMLTHGHGQNAYGHFSLGLWPSDPNFTISSLAKCLRNLEDFQGNKYGDLVNKNVEGPGKYLFDCMLSRDALFKDMQSKNQVNVFCMSEGSVSQQDVTSVSQQILRNDVTSVLPFKRLPKILLLQLDNCPSENKNRYVLAYLSMLVAHGVFNEVHLGFLMVGHTHEDIDALFSRLSESLRTSNITTLPHLMKEFIDCTSMHPTPFLMQEVADFKGFVKGYLKDGSKMLTGHKRPLQFRFYMDDGVPLMQYKLHPKSPNWMPIKGVELWKRDDQEKPMIPQGLPRILPTLEYVKECDKVCEGINKILSWWKSYIDERGEHSEYANWLRPLLEYWENAIVALRTPMVPHQDQQSFNHFWPRSSGTIDENMPIDDATCEEGPTILGLLNENEHHYCGPLCDKPQVEFNPQLDILVGDFVLVRPSDDRYPIWLGHALTNIVKDKENENYMKLNIQYWAPISRKKNVDDLELYKDCWTKSWRVNQNEQPQWQDAGCIVWAWKPKTSTQTSKMVKIPKGVVMKAKASLGLQSSMTCLEE